MAPKKPVYSAPLPERRPDKCPWHIDDKLSYIASFEDADRRHAMGQEQVQCPHCGYWIWPDQFGTPSLSDNDTKTLEAIVKATETGKKMKEVVIEYIEEGERKTLIIKDPYNLAVFQNAALSVAQKYLKSADGQESGSPRSKNNSH